MATDASFIDYLLDQSGLARELSFRKMFGEYALYLQGKVVAFVCDNQLFLKPTDEGRALLPEVIEGPPYPGAKLHLQLDPWLEDRELLRRLLLVTAAALPLPKPKPPRKTAGKAAQKTAGKTFKPR